MWRELATDPPILNPGEKQEFLIQDVSGYIAIFYAEMGRKHLHWSDTCEGYEWKAKEIKYWMPLPEMKTE